MLCSFWELCSPTSGRTHVPCIGRQIFNYQGDPLLIFFTLHTHLFILSPFYLLLYSLTHTSGASGKESACDARDMVLIPVSGRFLWRRKWQPTPVFLPGKFHGQRSPVGYRPWRFKSWTQPIQIYAHTHTHTHTPYSNIVLEINSTHVFHFHLLTQGWYNYLIGKHFPAESRF